MLLLTAVCYSTLSCYTHLHQLLVLLFAGKFSISHYCHYTLVLQFSFKGVLDTVYDFEACHILVLYRMYILNPFMIG
uniref:Uncharacterized protein n=1 Tax=Rhizophora mucronata TaxID=61149 RepID=A0A2P2M3D0_RHIMU